MSEQINEFMYVHRVKKILDCSDQCVYNMIKNGDLEAIKLGKRSVRVSKESLRNYIRKNKIDPEEYFEL